MLFLRQLIGLILVYALMFVKNVIGLILVYFFLIRFIFAYVPFMRRPIWIVAWYLAPESSIALYGCVVWSSWTKIRVDALRELSQKPIKLHRLFRWKTIPLLGLEILKDSELDSGFREFHLGMRIRIFEEVFCASDLHYFKRAIQLLLKSLKGDIGDPKDPNSDAHGLLVKLYGDYKLKMHVDCLKHLLKVSQINRPSAVYDGPQNAVVVNSDSLVRGS